MVFKSKKSSQMLSSSSSSKPIRWLVAKPKSNHAIVVPSSVNNDDTDTSMSSSSSTFFVASTPEKQPLHHNEEEEEEVDSSTKTKQKRHVTFKESSKVRLVVKAKDLVDSPNELWYQQSEFQRMNAKAFAIVKAVDNDSYKSKKAGARLCVRGLEKYLKVNKHKTIGLRKQAVNDVLNEQQSQQQKKKHRRQKQYNIDSYEAIAYAYNESSLYARKDALRRGMIDEKEAMKIHQ